MNNYPLSIINYPLSITYYLLNTMCFSPTASFATGILLIPAGIYCLNEVGENQREYLPIAAWPFVFGIQQLFEGLLWLGIDSNQLMLIHVSSFGFLFFSHFFWPFWTPISAFYLESNNSIKTILFVLIFLGFFYGLLLYIPLVLNDNFIDITILKNSLNYRTQFIFDDFFPKNFSFWFYSLIILGSLFISSNRSLNYLGLLLFLSALATYMAFSYAFISVWCFFAAIVSIYLIYTVHNIVMVNANKV